MAIRISQGVILTLALAAVVAPAAFARPPEEASFNAAESTPVRPDDRAGVRGIGAGADAATTVIASAAATRPDDKAVRFIAESPIVATSAGDGFQWGDAGIGAAAASALLAALGGLIALAIVLRSRRTEATMPDAVIGT
jgi:hypothetical protein